MAEKHITVTDVLKTLPKTNCRECGVPACMTFAAMVVQGTKTLSDCPYIDEVIKQQMSGAVVRTQKTAEEERDELLNRLKEEVVSIDFRRISEKIGVELVRGRLAVRCFGKVFELDQQGELHTLCHINPWVHLPIINYVVRAHGRDLTGDWVRFSELKHAKDWVRFFQRRCEYAMQNMYDDDPDLFLNIVSLFASNDPNENLAESESADHVFTLFPLPKVGFRILVWEADGQFESKLSLLFDRSAEDNLGTESIYLLGVGFLEMLKRISERHGRG